MTPGTPLWVAAATPIHRIGSGVVVADSADTATTFAGLLELLKFVAPNAVERALGRSAAVDSWAGEEADLLVSDIEDWIVAALPATHRLDHEVNPVTWIGRYMLRQDGEVEFETGRGGDEPWRPARLRPSECRLCGRTVERGKDHCDRCRERLNEAMARFRARLKSAPPETQQQEPEPMPKPKRPRSSGADWNYDPRCQCASDDARMEVADLRVREINTDDFMTEYSLKCVVDLEADSARKVSLEVIATDTDGFELDSKWMSGTAEPGSPTSLTERLSVYTRLVRDIAAWKVKSCSID